MKGARRRILAAAVIALVVGGAGAIFLVDYFRPVKSNIRRLGNPDERVQKQAVNALVQMGQTAVPALAEALKDKNSVVRTNAAQALVQIGEPAVPYLIGALGVDHEPDVRRSAAGALVQIGEPAVPALINALGYESSPFPMFGQPSYAEDALVQIGDPAVFTVSLSALSTTPVTVNYATADGTATAGSDYQSMSGTLTFAPGETSKTITVQVIGDRLAEPNETFTVNLRNPTNANIGNGQGVGTILDDEPRISISDVSKKEGRTGQTTLFTFTVTLSAAYDQPVTMLFRTVDGTATTSDHDYVAQTGTLTFNPG